MSALRTFDCTLTLVHTKEGFSDRYYGYLAAWEAALGREVLAEIRAPLHAEDCWCDAECRHQWAVEADAREAYVAGIEGGMS